VIELLLPSTVDGNEEIPVVAVRCAATPTIRRFCSVSRERAIVLHG
jgi:hypothetical protein